MIFTATEVARRREPGPKPKYPEAVVSAELLEGARDGRSVADLKSFGATILARDDVMEQSQIITRISIETRRSSQTSHVGPATSDPAAPNVT